MCQFHGGGTPVPSPGRLGRRALLVGAGGSVAALALSSVAQAAPRALGRTWAIVGATAIDSVRSHPLADATVLVHGNRIARVGRRREVVLPPSTTVIDGHGKYVIPGLVDMHHHLGGTSLEERAANLRQLLAFGYTSIFDPAVSLPDLVALKAFSGVSDAPYPRYFGTGPMLGTPGGWGDFGTPETRVVPSASAAASIVAEFAAHGADAIKVANDNVAWGGGTAAEMPEDVQVAIVAAARRHRLRVFFHAPSLRLASQALRAGASGLLHGIVDAPLDAAFLRLLRRSDASALETFSLFETLGDVVSYVGRQQAFDRLGLYPSSVYDALRSPEAIAAIEAFVDPSVVVKHLATLRSNSRRLFSSGANATFGSDGGTFSQALGISSHLELAVHESAGLRPHEILRGATLGAARMLGRAYERGSLAPGKLADLVLLNANPLTSIANLHFVDQVAKDGHLFRARDLLT